MRRYSVLLAFSAALILAGCSDEGTQTNQTPTPISQPAAGAPDAVSEGKGFDFYVLALSWSPSYCESKGEDANRQQCGATRPYGFVVHGLWPQYERGYPSDCSVSSQDVPQDLARSLYDIMPSNGLIRQQWRKHGSCAGLSQDDYFDVLRAARTRVQVPADYQRVTERKTIEPKALEQAFVAANAGMTADGFVIACDGQLMEEVRVCMTKSLQFRACPEVEKRECRARKLVMPAMKAR